jgi:hypothetical protein
MSNSPIASRYGDQDLSDKSGIELLFPLRFRTLYRQPFPHALPLS